MVVTLGPAARARLAACASLVFVVPFGLATKRFPIEAAPWVAESAGGAFYVIFFCLFARLLWPTARAWLAALAVLVATCGVEVLQLWHPAWLDAIRATRPGGLVLGSSFSWADFPWYFLGAACGLAWLAAIDRVARRGAPRDDEAR